MTAEEFKAWFEGFCEAVDGTPTPEQFAKIKDKVKQLGASVKYRDLLGAPRTPFPNRIWEGVGSPDPFRQIYSQNTCGAKE